MKEAVNQEIEQLRFNIQALSRVANPLGKLLDHIQEDAEVMRQELQQWTNVYDEVSKEMQKQKMSVLTLFYLFVMKLPIYNLPYLKLDTCRYVSRWILRKIHTHEISFKSR